MLTVEIHRGNSQAVRQGSYGWFLYNWFRYYDPSIGRYASADPVGQFGLLTEADATGVPLPMAASRSLSSNGPSGDVEVAGWDANVFTYALANPASFWDSSGLSTDTYHADKDAHGGPHIDRRNKAGQTVGRYRPDGSPIPHKGKTPPPVPNADKKKFERAKRGLRSFAPIPGVSSYDAYCKQNPVECAQWFGEPTSDPCVGTWGTE
jgi:uncharacterized protein RhaS with RHS repeats